MLCNKYSDKNRGGRNKSTKKEQHRLTDRGGEGGGGVGVIETFYFTAQSIIIFKL